MENPISLPPHRDLAHVLSLRDPLLPDLAPPSIGNMISVPPHDDLVPRDPIRPDLAPPAMKSLVSLVDKLKRACTALADQGEKSALPADWDALPTIAVVGGQSAGKSSVLESVVGMDFLPRGSGIVTRRPLVLELHRTDGTREYAEFMHQPNKTYTDLAEVRKELADKTERSKEISSVPIHLSIFSPSVVNLTLIDLPGLTKIAVEGQSESIVQEIENMVRAFIEKPNCIILAVSPANQDLATSDAMKISQEVDPKGERTFGVLTKIDLMDKGTDAVDILEGRSYRLQFPWIGVVNRSQQDINKSVDMIAARRRERDYFANTPEYKHLAHRMGSEHLAKSLLKHLECVIKARIPAGYLFSDITCIKSTVTKKNKLQGYTLKVYGTYPVYQLSPEGAPHCMTFGCTVDVKGQMFVSAARHVHRKDAEEDAADVAYTALMGNETLKTLFGIVNKDEVSKINLLKEYALKKKVTDPESTDAVYGSSRVAVESQATLWLSTVTLDNETYIGDVAKTKRLSVQNAASEAVRSMLDAGNDLMIKLVLGKRHKLVLDKKKSRKEAIGGRKDALAKNKQIVSEPGDETS